MLSSLLSPSPGLTNAAQHPRQSKRRGKDLYEHDPEGIRADAIRVCWEIPSRKIGNVGQKVNPRRPAQGSKALLWGGAVRELLAHGLNHFLQHAPVRFSDDYKFNACAVPFIQRGFMDVNDPSSDLDCFVFQAEGDENILPHFKGSVGFEQEPCLTHVPRATHAPAHLLSFVIEDDIIHKIQILFAVMPALS
jgi:hypothetical protein